MAEALSAESRRQGCSINQTVLDLLRRTLGLEADAAYDTGLARLAGSWTEEDLARFEENTAVFERNDEELWRE